ncbi:MAG: stage II sporulation protein M [Candidatus Bathyarchaeota archaeon]|nr:stage II sporulation protein M [Candidatus Bathyarchaeota archaeon]
MIVRFVGMEDIGLKESFFASIWETLASSVQRSKTIIKVIAMAFFGVIIISMLVTFLAFSTNPMLLEWFNSLMQHERSYIAIPPPYTNDLYFFILLNNAGHFWNPIRMLVWVPLLGTFVMGFELLLNGVLIGALSIVVGTTKGVFYPILGIAPHGIIEIPAFILEFASLICWHVTIIEALMAKVTGEKVNVAKFKQGVKDALILAVVSVTLFVIAAFIETYITPHLLGL